MPNFKLGPTIKNTIKERVKGLMQNRLDHVQGNFPLTAENVQSRILTEEQLSMLRTLAAQGIKPLPHGTGLHLLIDRDRFPELHRAAILHLVIPDPVFTPRDTTYGYFNQANYDWQRNCGDVYSLRPNWTGLDPEIERALVAWVNEAVKARRQQELVLGTVGDVIERLTSSGELLAVWPGLASLTDDPEWRSRFRNAPAKLQRYVPDPDWTVMYVRHMQASDILLTGAQLLGKYEHPNGRINACVQVWEQLPKDRK